MNKSIRWGQCGLLMAAGFFAAQVAAVDFIEAAPKNTRVLVDNDKVRVIRATFHKGDKIPMHSHPDIVVYIVKGGGKVKFTNADGSVKETQNKAGDAFFRPAVTHSHEHFGDDEAIIIELKK